MITRAWSQLQIKSFDEDLRVLEGVASTPVTDRQSDIVDPKGAKFKLPIPFLWQHDSRSPIGHVIAAKVSDEGITVKVQLAKTEEPGEVKNLLDKAWQFIKLGLVRGLSIGFNPIEHADIAGTWGRHFKLWEFLELSAVTIAANPDAFLTSIKSLEALDDSARLQLIKSWDERALADEVERRVRGDRKQLPGASGVSIKPKPKPKEGTVKNHAERIAEFEAALTAKLERQNDIQNKANEEGRTKNAAEQEEFNTLKDEIAAIKSELVDLRELQKEAVATAKPVDPTPKAEAATQSRGGSTVIVEREEKLEKGIGFSRYAMLKFAAKGDMPLALQLAKEHYPKMTQVHRILELEKSGNMEKHIERMMLLQKANVSAAQTQVDAWAGALLAYNELASEFVEFLRARTILGQFGRNGIPSLNQIPFNVNIKMQTSGGTGYWVGEGKPKPLTSFGFDSTYHGWFKVAAIAVLTEEMIRFSDPSAERLVRNALGDTLQERLDTDFVDPAFAGVANVSPASITNGVTAIPSSGTDADAIRADLQDLWAAAIAANADVTQAVYITTPSIAMALGLMMNPLGQQEFPGMSMTGGTLLGVRVIVSNYVPAGTFILVFANEIWFSDDGQATIDASREASIQMLDNPTNDSVTPTPTSLVSMFQTDSVALRAHRFVNWSKRRATAVALLEDVAWGGAISS